MSTAVSGAKFRAPLGIAVIGGVVTSTLLTLLVIPTVYEILSDWRDARAAKLSHIRTDPVGVGREASARGSTRP